jgi:putative Holliday junction resolvase
MNFLGIDYGEKRIGLAIAHREIKIASPYGVLENKSPNFVLKEIKKICKTENIGKIIVGLPISLSGKLGPKAKEVLRFVKFLKKNLKITVETEDERLTSVAVNKIVKGQKLERDAVAAAIILQNFLDKYDLSNARHNFK